MENTFTGRVIEIKKSPAMGRVITRGLFLSMVRPDTVKTGKEIEKAAVVLQNVKPDPRKLAVFKAVCRYSSADPELPACFLQTLFIGLLGKYITSDVFPVNPMGLIHTVQKMVHVLPVHVTDSLDLWCRLKETRQTEKGLELDFELQATRDSRLVWQGLSSFLLKDRTRSRKKKKVPETEEIILPVREIFDVPTETGWNYAKASGDYNPHHISRFFARMFGFKTRIAHGMWSMARSLAAVEQATGFHYPLTVETSFKLPVFLPARVSLGYDRVESEDRPAKTVMFELRDADNRLPHIKGRVVSPSS